MLSSSAASKGDFEMEMRKHIWNPKKTPADLAWSTTHSKTIIKYPRLSLYVVPPSFLKRRTKNVDACTL
jgi:hypothetical protein